MTNATRISRLAMINVALIAMLAGCDKQKAADNLKSAKESVEKTSRDVAEGAAEMAKKGEKLASDLGTEAMAFVNPLKEKIGELGDLEKTPEKLKTAISDLITMIENKAESIKLPESITQTIANLKEKLVSLKVYLEGEYDQAKIGEHLKGIMESVKSGFGM